MRRFLTVALAAVLAAGTLLSATGASATAGGPVSTASSSSAVMPASVEIKLGTQPVRLTKSGQVPLALRIRCSAGVQTFEMYVDVVQPSGAGNVGFAAPPFIVSCNGTWERVTVKVPASVGAFAVGRADVTASLYAYLPAPEDHDIDVGVGQSVWVGPHK